MDIVESFYQEMNQTYPGISRSDCEEAMQIALVKTTNSLWKIVKQQRNEIKCRDVKRMEKQDINVIAEVGTFEKAKELLADLEVLNEKYCVSVQLSIFQQVNFEGYHKQTQ